MKNISEIEEYESIENIEKNKMEEGNWIPVIDFPDYMVSDQGHIKKTKSGRILKEHKDKDGYLRIWMSDGDERIELALIHHIVYFSFHPEELYSIIEKQLEEEEKMSEEDIKEIFNSLDGEEVN